jgi:hypothetical protein
MRSHAWIRVTLNVLAAAGAAGSMICGAVLISAVVSLGWLMICDGSGGIGAVSVGVSEGALPVLLVCVAASLLLFGRARRSGRLVARLQRAHAVTLAVGFGLLALLVSSLWFSIPELVLFAGILTCGLFFGVQFLLLAAVLIGLISRGGGLVAPESSR